MRHAVAVLSYVNRPALGARLVETLRTLRGSGYPGDVVVVDDGSPAGVRDWGAVPPGVRVVQRAENGGVSRGKNTCLRVLSDLGVDVGFLADDDVEFRAGWWEAYLEAHSHTGIAHFCWASSGGHGAEMAVRGHVVRRVERLNGLLLSFTPEVVKKVGGFPVSPVRWGWDHVNWSNRIVAARLSPGVVDVVGSDALVAINRYGGDSAVSEEQRRECRNFDFDRVGEVFRPMVE